MLLLCTHHKSIKVEQYGNSHLRLNHITYKISHMKAIDFINRLREQVIEEDNKAYQNLFDVAIDAKDPIWKDILSIYKDMPKEQQLAFLHFIRMIQANTLSHILGVLDGTTPLTKTHESFILKTKGNEASINGNLQDLFLVMEEEM